jgi:glycosyltransferase involved in cell wall biosynthesis
MAPTGGSTASYAKRSTIRKKSRGIDGRGFLDDELMRILIVSTLYPPQYEGGYELRCAQVAEALRLAGHDVCVLTSRHGLPLGPLGVAKRRTEERKGVVIHRWLGEHVFGPFPKLRRPWTAWTAKRELEDVKGFIDLLKAFRPDVVNWWSMYGLTKAMLPLPRAWGIPDIHWIEHWWMIAEYGPSGEIASAFWNSVWDGLWGPRLARPFLRVLGRMWERRAARQGIPTRDFPNRPAHVCFVSEHMRRIHQEAGIAFDSSEIIHGGVPVADFYQPVGHRDNRRGMALRLLYVGQLSQDRGLHTVIEAMGRLEPQVASRVRLTVAGAGNVDYERSVRKLASDLGLADRVTFLGRVSHEKMVETYKEHDVLVFPSMRDEGLPLTMVEAMLAGCAVVTTGSGGAETVAAAADLPRFPKGGGDELSRLLAFLAADPEEVSRLAARGQLVALEEFSFDRMMKRWIATLERVAGDRHGPPNQRGPTATRVATVSSSVGIR